MNSNRIECRHVQIAVTISTGSDVDILPKRNIYGEKHNKKEQTNEEKEYKKERTIIKVPKSNK